MACSSSTSSGSEMAQSSLSSANCSSLCSKSDASTSLLSKLRAPQPSDLSRKRKLAPCGPASKGKRRAAPRGTHTDPKSVTPAQRVSEFPDEQLKVSACKLFCTACLEEVGLKRSIIQNHVKSTKHMAGKMRLERKEARERDISEALHRHDKTVNQKGATLPASQRVYV